jgi:hypothetical protein
VRDSPDNPEDELEVEPVGGAKALAGDLSVHFSTRFDAVLSRRSVIVMDGEAFSLELEQHGASLWAPDTARAFADGCDSKAVNAGSCTAPFEVKNWVGCYQTCAATPTMQVWSYEPNLPGGLCRCSELPGAARPGIHGARSGRLRDAPAVVADSALATVAEYSRYAGDEYSQIVTDLEGCRSACISAGEPGSAPQCLAYSYVPNGVCWLKGKDRAIPLSYPAKDGRTGVSKAGALVEQVLHGHLQNNVVFAQVSIRSLKVRGWDECSEECAAEKLCAGWTFYKGAMQCYLNGLATEILDDENAVSQRLPSLTVRVYHAAAGDERETVELSARLQGFFEGSLTIVRNTAARTYTLYVDGALVKTVPYTKDPVAAPALEHLGKLAGQEAKSPELYVPVANLALFDRALEAADVQALLARQAPRRATTTEATHAP